MIFKSFICCLFLLSIVSTDVLPMQTPKIKKMTTNTVSEMIRPAYLKIGDTIIGLKFTGNRLQSCFAFTKYKIQNTTTMEKVRSWYSYNSIQMSKKF